jgi:chromosome segregation ATPase
MSKESDKAQPEDRPIAEVDRIRDIIFGSQMRSYDRQFKEVAGQLDLLSKQLEELRSALDQQRAAQEMRTNDLQGEVRQRSEEVRNDLSDRMQQQNAALETQLRQLASDLRKQGRDLRNQFTAALDALDEAKTDRHNLGDLLMELGMRLKQEGQLAELLDQLGETAEG